MSANTISSLQQLSKSSVKVKAEKHDAQSNKHKGQVESFIVNNPQLSQLQARDVTITVSVSSASSNANSANHHQSSSKKVVTNPPQSKPKETQSSDSKAEPPSIDFSSVCGKFGWTTIGTVHLPYLMRGEDSFVAVRMVESKIISTYVDILPWTVFACTNIKSYYVTDNEAKLLNEINGFHCNFHFGYQTFSAKDVVVHLRDTVKFYEFLESCRTKLHSEGGNPLFKEQCGFVMVNCSAIPYIKKGTKKYVLYNMAYQEGVSSPISCIEKVSEWDMAYLRFLSSVASIDQKYLKLGTALCALDDLDLGSSQLQEWWPNLQYSSKSNRPLLSSSSNGMLSKCGDSLPFVQPELLSQEKCSQKLRDKITEYQAKEKILNPFSDLDKHLDLDWQSIKSTGRSHSKAIQSLPNDNRAHLFPSSLEGLLSASTHAMNYQLPYGGQIQSSLMSDSALQRASEGGLSSLATSRPRPFPPPPPLVRLGESSRSTTVPIINHCNMPKPQPSLYPYIHPGVTPTDCPPWLAHVLEPNWMHADDRRKDHPLHQSSELANVPVGHNRSMSSDSPWNPLTSGFQGSGLSASSNCTKNYSSRVLRECYDPSYSALCRDDRLSAFQRGSPRPATGAGPPPHYPTPPQSSPLQPLSFLDCSSLPGLTEIYNMRSTPHVIGELCSPPPSPEARTALPLSPRTNYGSGNTYQSHIVRLAQVESRYVLAINVEPYKHNSTFAVPVSDVVSKFLRGTSVESCQVVLETVFQLHLYECTRLHQEAYAKHNVAVVPGSKLVSVDDVRSYLYQLRLLLAERGKHKDKSYSFRADLQQPLSKRWCGTE